jgi:hypothetical protein
MENRDVPQDPQIRLPSGAIEASNYRMLNQADRRFLHSELADILDDDGLKN